MLSKVWDDITYPFPNFNGCAVDVWERISNFIPHFIIDMIMLGLKLNHVRKGYEVTQIHLKTKLKKDSMNAKMLK